jgi:hypothetical protein
MFLAAGLEVKLEVALPGADVTVRPADVAVRRFATFSGITAWMYPLCML